MKVIVQNHYDFITTNGYLFTNRESDIGYNLLKPWNDLYLAADERGIKMYTPDQITSAIASRPRESVDVAIYMDVPKSRVPAKKSILIIYECPMLLPQNWEPALHDSMDKVFTWNDNLVDNVKYFKNNLTCDLQDARPLELTREQFLLRKPVVLMQTRKHINHPDSLYGKREEAIRFFEAKAAGMFDLWGRNWNGFSSWRGAAANKMQVLKNYRFCIAFENCNNVPGYITEKILDCMLAGVVPIYWGAPNVTDHIPAECFIDMRRFKYYEELLEFLNDITYDDYMKYMTAIHNYIASPQSKQFYNTYFVDMMISHMEAA